jgi:tRNA threonylcarbamoyladenosine biosynthesis protein TsaB
MIVLGLDTALPACSVAVVRDGQALASLSEPMSRGHQERLAVMVREAMQAAGLAFTALDRIAVTVGPGSFTGLRVGLAFAKGLALALDRPCVGIGSLQALAASVEEPGVVFAAIDAKRGQLYVQAFERGAALSAPAAVDLADAAARLTEVSGWELPALVGSGAVLLAGAQPAGGRIVDRQAPDPVAVARLGAGAPLVPPQPLYLRAPDARLPAA